MKKVIPKGWHYAIPPGWIHFGRETIECEFQFSDNCRYDIGENQKDWNKLFGLSWGMPHDESARIAWRYNLETELWEIGAYPYVEGVNKYTEMLESVNQDIVDSYFVLGSVGTERNAARIDASGIFQTYSLNKGKPYKQPSTTRGWGFLLGTYFGGPVRATHRMDLKVSRIRYINDSPPI